MPKPLTVLITTDCKILRDGNTRPPDLPAEKLVFRFRSNSQNWTWNNGLVPNWERSTSRLYIVTLLIWLIYWVHHEKCWAGWSTSWNQDCQEKYQQPQICRRHHPYVKKWRGTKETLDESERGQWKTCLKLNIQKTMIMASGSITPFQIDGEIMETVTDYFFLGGGLQKSLQMVTAAMKLKDTCSFKGKLWPT